MAINMLRCKITKLAETILPAVVADVPVCVYGQTGIGKSSVINYDLVPQLSRILGIEAVMHDYRFSTKDVVDGTGMPIIDPIKRRTDWTCPAFIPEDDGRLHVIFCDEIGHANVQMQHLGYGLVNDRALGGYKLPKHNRVLLATNTREDQGGDNKLLLPFCNRMGHVLAESDAPGHIENMKRWGYDSRLIAFLSLRPDEIQKVSDANPAFPTHRSVEMLNKILKALPLEAPKAAIENSAHLVVGEGFSRQFITFLNNLAAGLPKMSDIKANPAGAKVPTDPHYQWVIGSAVSKELDAHNAVKLSTYLERLMPDVRSMAAHDAMTRDPNLKQVAELKSLVLGA